MTDILASRQGQAIHSPTTSRAPATRRPATARPGVVLAIVLAGQFMAVLDASVVNVAAPSIHGGLHASGAGLQLVIAGYTIAYAVLLVTGARVGDLLGHRRVFLAGAGSSRWRRLAAGWPARPECSSRCASSRAPARRP